MKRSLIKIKKIFENDLNLYGNSLKGVGWKNPKDAKKRYEVMYKLFSNDKSQKKILDFGCGLSHFYSFLKEKKVKKFEYIGMDISEKMISLSKKKFPKNNYICEDIIANSRSIPRVDYIIINGLFTQKGHYSKKKMLLFIKQIISYLYKKTNKAIAFNFMSPYVDWKNDKNFYLDLNSLLNELKKVSKNFKIIHNYGLYEYTLYMYKIN